MTRIQLPQAYLEEILGGRATTRTRPEHRSNQVPMNDLWAGIRRIAARRSSH